jgi:adenosylmethionine-8-amino-7-oxononanoate aminotransferase
VLDRQTQAIMPAPQMQKLVDYCKAQGIIVGRSMGTRFNGNCIVLAPPLVLTRAEIDRVVQVLDEGITTLTASM